MCVRGGDAVVDCDAPLSSTKSRLLYLHYQRHNTPHGTSHSTAHRTAQPPDAHHAAPRHSLQEVVACVGAQEHVVFAQDLSAGGEGQG